MAFASRFVAVQIAVGQAAGDAVLVLELRQAALTVLAHTEGNGTGALEQRIAKSGLDIVSVRIGRVVDVELETSDRAQALAELEQMSHDLLANPLIESYEIELEEA